MKVDARADSEKEFKEELKSIYTPLAEAKKELERRWKDEGLRKKVEDYLGGNVLEFLKDSPKAAIVRHVSSPNHELLYFIDLVKMLDIDYRCVEFPKDKFVSVNSDKYRLGKLHIFDGMGKNMEERINVKKIIEIQDVDGKKFSEIKTLWGEDLVDLHHRLLFSILPETKDKIFDISEWFFKNGPSSKDFYKYYMASFICHGVLFENFSMKEKTRESDFTKKIVIPALKELKDIFGVLPLIIPVSPVECETDLHWQCYPASVGNFFQKTNNK